jgi:hypothetical protein
MELYASCVQCANQFPETAASGRKAVLQCTIHRTISLAFAKDTYQVKESVRHMRAKDHDDASEG